MTENNWRTHQIEAWLIENKSYFNFLLNETNCIKWNNWHESKSTHIYPCVCPIREQACIFIETYTKLEKIIELYNLEEDFKKFVSNYRLISNSKIKVIEWLSKHEETFDNLGFNLTVEVVTSIKPYEVSKLHLEATEFSNILEFQKIYIDETFLNEN